MMFNKGSLVLGLTTIIYSLYLIVAFYKHEVITGKDLVMMLIGYIVTLTIVGIVFFTFLV